MAESSNSNKDTELTMCDVLQEEQELEEDANAVLGGSDDTNCSYDEGYVPRQALYACKTCKISGEAGVCLACCYACHDGHEVVELYTKRNFRCDCGNSKFIDKKCTLRADKEPLNDKNKYNHNFNGLYCSCSRPYPDLEDDVPDEMIQCVICEDWYHGRHLGVSIPDDYAEMVCESCMQSHTFLYRYLGKYNVVVDVDDTLKNGKDANDGIVTSDSVAPVSANSVIENGETCIPKKDVNDTLKNPNDANDSVKSSDCVTPESTNSVVGNNETCIPKNDVNDTHKNPNDSIKSSDCVTPESVIENGETCIPKNDVDDTLKNLNDSIKSSDCVTPESVIENGETCLLKKLSVDGITTGSALWPENWRKELCRCTNCMVLYTDSDCKFLLDPDDTIHAYEERGKGRSGQSQYDKGLSALGQLDRVQQMEAVRAYSSMKGELKEYLKEFAENKRTVSASDITEFFERMKKKRKLNNGVPHFCR